jgi:hypothetical protein
MVILQILDIRRITDTYDRKSHTENSSALLERFRNAYEDNDSNQSGKRL